MLEMELNLNILQSIFMSIYIYIYATNVQLKFNNALRANSNNIYDINYTPKTTRDGVQNEKCDGTRL